MIYNNIVRFFQVSMMCRKNYKKLAMFEKVQLSNVLSHLDFKRLKTGHTTSKL